jgi:hypothetical protein
MEAGSILKTLDEHGVEYVVVGPAAAWLRGAGEQPAFSLDVCYRQTWNNCECLTRALDELRAEPVPPRSAPIPLTTDLRQSRDPLRLETLGGPLVLLSTIPGLGSYEDLGLEATRVRYEGVEVPVLTSEQLSHWSVVALGDPLLLAQLLPPRQEEEQLDS